MENTHGNRRLLVVDDDSAVRTSLNLLLRRAGYGVRVAESPKEAIFWLGSNAADLVVMDMNYSRSTTGDEGIFLLEHLKSKYPEMPVILMTAWGSIELAVRGMQLGAFDFITKPWDNHKLLQSISNALELTRKVPAETVTLTSRKELERHHEFGAIVGQSGAIIDLLRTIVRIAPTTASVLITGESGTGKELIAEAIHRNSTRAAKPFVKVNLGGISTSLFESEMFGHKRGAFTDAVAERVGRFKLADGGTIFLDEIGELDVSSQVKLLRVLQEQTFEVLGESKPTKVDVRVVSATNADLKAMVAEGTFREDLFYRINLIVLRVPPLRERGEDILLLTRHFADSMCRKNNLPLVRFTPEAEQCLMAMPYPGNVRELKNLVERTILISGKAVIDAGDIAREELTSSSSKEVTMTGTIEEVEAEMIKAKLKEYNGNCSRVAKALGLSRGALYRRLEKYGIQL